MASPHPRPAHRRPVRAALVLGLGAAVALGACSSTNEPTVVANQAKPAGSSPATAAPTTAPPAGSTVVTAVGTSTTVTVDTVALPPTTKAPVPPTTKVAPPPAKANLPIDIADSTDGTSPNGSGCTPPAGDSLPDGLWYGVVREVLPHEKSIALDLACYYTGAAASKAAGVPGPVENDVFVTNVNPKEYFLGFGDDTEVALLQNDGGSPDFQPVALGLDPLMGVTTGPGDQFVVWVVLDHGKVIGIQQQFHP